MRDILLPYGIAKEAVNAMMILYQNIKTKSRSPDSDTDFFDINAGILQGDTLVPFTFIVCLVYVLRKSLDAQTDWGFILTQQTSSRYPCKKVTAASMLTNFAVLSDQLKDKATLLRSAESAASEIRLYINVLIQCTQVMAKKLSLCSKI